MKLLPDDEDLHPRPRQTFLRGWAQIFSAVFLATLLSGVCVVSLTYCFAVWQANQVLKAMKSTTTR